MTQSLLSGITQALPGHLRQGWAHTSAIAMLILVAASPLGHAQANPPSGTETKPGAPTAADQKAKTPGRALTIIVPDVGEKYVRILPSSDAKQPAELPIPFQDKKTTVTIPDTAGKSPKIAVDNVKTGNTAVMPIPADKDTLELHNIDFSFVHRFEVKVAFDNKPVQVAQVTLVTEDKNTAVKMIDVTSQGTAVFNDVPSGKAKLTVVYGDKLTQSQDVPVTSDHPGGYVTVTVPVSNKVPTLDVPSAPAAVSAPGGAPAAGPSAGVAPATGIQPTPPQTPEGGGFAGVIGTVISLLVAAGGIYLLYRWAQTGGMAATLKKFGIEVAGPVPGSDAGTPWNPNAPPPPVVSDPSICQFCGMMKDASGNCACTLSGAAINTGPSSAAVPVHPRLVATMGIYSGSVFPINANGSAMTVGREATNSIALGNDTTVSRRHASIRVENGSYLVADEGSANGVFLNGVKITGPQPLRPGDEVQIGNTRFRFEV